MTRLGILILIRNIKVPTLIKNRQVKMKIDNTFHILAFFMIVITFSLPLTSLAQPSPAEVQAEADAIADANKDVNKTLWFGAGCLLSGLVYIPSPGLFINCLFPPAGIAGTYFYRPSPPIARFVGKSPEYISVYTSTYKSKRGSIQASMASAGCATGCIATGGTLLVIGFILLDDFEIPTE